MNEVDEAKEIDRWIVELLDNKSLNGMSTSLRGLRRGRFFEERYFELYLRDYSGRVSQSPVVSGLYFAGRGKWIKPWAEIGYHRSADFEEAKGGTERVSLTDTGLDVALFRLLSGLIPPGGHLAVEYQGDETGLALAMGIPAAATPLGHLMWKSGFRWFKNWYFPEGWKEGGTKLQGNRPLDGETKSKREEEAAKELRKFIEGLPPAALGDVESRAVKRAREILSGLEGL
jgi:hypothetical protein